MIAVLVTILIAVIPALFIAESIAKRRKLAKWKRRHVNIGDDQSFASLGSVSLSRDAAIRVRSEVARATKLPANLISATDSISELERVGDLSHSSTMDYFTDLLPVEEPRDASELSTVGDFVRVFAPQLQSDSEMRESASAHK